MGADTDDRKRAEDELRRSEFYLTEAERLVHAGSWAFTPDGVTHYWSEGLYRLLGFDPARGIPPLAEYIRSVHPDDRALVEQALKDLTVEGRRVEIKYRMFLPERGLRIFLGVASPLRENGIITRFLGTTLDITEQHEAKAALEKAFAEIEILKEQLDRENIALREEVDKAYMFEEIVGTAPALRAVLSRVAKVAPTDSTVLISGETGTGKELIARAIHKRSQRSTRAFISVNCAAIPRDLIASELFGHEKGAFTGALQRRLGRFELAAGGTIFLDEIGELPAETQVAMLRVLQEREFERVGGSQPIRADVRVIAATNRDLEAAVSGGTFRQDLFYRFNVFPIEVPPLRERSDDIRLLVEYFVDRYARKAGKTIRSINTKTLELFKAYGWPGNVRELQNVIERSIIVCESENFSVDKSWLSREPVARRAVKERLPERLVTQEKELIEAALLECRGRVYGKTGAAAKLGIPPSTLDSKIRSLKIDKTRF